MDFFMFHPFEIINIDLNRLRDQVASLVSLGASSIATQQTYAACWRVFERWCANAGVASLPATEDTVCCYLAARAADSKLSTVRVHAWAIDYRHRHAGLPSPFGDRARTLLTGVARQHGQRAEPKAALTPADLRRILRRLDRRTTAGARDAAVLLLGFATGLRRSDLVALDVGDVSPADKGFVVMVGRRRREKNDQDGKGRQIAVFRGCRQTTCPVRALQQWLRLRGDQPGPLFTRIDRNGAATTEQMTAATVSYIVKRAAKAIGRDPSEYGAHSLRAGMVTACSAAGVPDSAIMQRSGHKSVQMVARYIRHADLFVTNPLAAAL
jgi:integrase